MYAKGEGVSQDFKKSFHWYLQAATQGFAEAQYCVAQVYYFHGEVVDKDMDQAYIWWKKSADQGFDAAQYYVGKNINVF
jgi:TPR repeat protein